MSGSGYIGQPPVQGGGDQFYYYAMGQEIGPCAYQNLQFLVASGQLKGDANVRVASGGSWFPAKEVPGLFSDKEWLSALLISIFVGHLGIDRFYLGYVGLGILKLVTCGGFFVWYLIDLVLIAARKLPDSDGRPLR